MKNKKLIKRIIDENGCIISEYPPGMSFSKGNFIQRDRIQSGICTGIIVVESDISGGTMHTVKYCLDQKRLLGCIRHPERYIEYEQAEGNQAILDIDALDRFKKKIDLELYKLIHKSRKPICGIEIEHNDSILRFINNTKLSLPEIHITNISNISNYYIYAPKGNISIPINANNVEVKIDNKKKRNTRKIKKEDESQSILKNIYDTN